MMVWKMIFLFNWVIFRFHVNLPGCITQFQQPKGQKKGQLMQCCWHKQAHTEEQTNDTQKHLVFSWTVERVQEFGANLKMLLMEEILQYRCMSESQFAKHKKNKLYMNHLFLCVLPSGATIYEKHLGTSWRFFTLLPPKKVTTEVPRHFSLVIQGTIETTRTPLKAPARKPQMLFSPWRIHGALAKITHMDSVDFSW